MSRRGRGTSRGRGGRYGGTQKIGGLEVTFDSQLEYDSPQPTPTYPVSNSFIRSTQPQITASRHPSKQSRASLTRRIGLQSHPTPTSQPPRKKTSRALPNHPKTHPRRPLLHRPGRQRADREDRRSRCCSDLRSLRGNADVYPEIHQEVEETTQSELSVLWYSPSPSLPS